MSPMSGKDLLRLNRTYSAAVLGDGHVLPIVEAIGRRQLREIEPLSREGRALLVSGRVTLWHDDGARRERIGIAEVLERQATRARALRAEHPDAPGCTQHHDRTLRSIGRMKKALTSTP
jgi:hypothetical protein